MNIFPIIQPTLAEKRTQELPLYRDVEWDEKTNTPVWRGGNPAIATGIKAVYAWAWRALQTERRRHEPYSWNYGCALEALIGQSFSSALKRAEAVRDVRECLLVNPYITEVDNVTVDMEGDKLEITCRLVTIYGEVNLYA